MSHIGGGLVGRSVSVPARPMWEASRARTADPREGGQERESQRVSGPQPGSPSPDTRLPRPLSRRFHKEVVDEESAIPKRFGEGPRTLSFLRRSLDPT